MEHSYIPRTLWCEDKNQEKTEFTQADLLQKKRPLVVLGEAGMGKTELMKWLGQQTGYTYCTAKQLIALAKPQRLMNEACVLVIDALDEAPSHQEKDAVDNVLAKLEQLDYPRFILSCRAVEWRSATASGAIKDHYEEAALQLHLNPFSKSDIEIFLEQHIGATRSTALLAHFKNLGLHDWLGNPQTLNLIVTVSLHKDLPKTRSELFSMAVEQLALEHNEYKAAQQLSTQTTLMAAGAACASLILCGQSSIVRKAGTQLQDGEILLQQLQTLPYGEHLTGALNTRLFQALAPNQFGYMHRRIGEYLAAKWLSALADTDRKRRRLLSSFHIQDLVPASLRGVYAWLAHDPHLARQVIESDPIAIVEYGEVDDLPPVSTRLLLQALEKVTQTNPRQWQLRSMRVRCFAQTALQPEVKKWLDRQEPALAWLRVLVIESLQEKPMAGILKTQLLGIVSSSKEFYVTRSAAFKSISALLSVQETTQLLHELENLADEDSLRLALNIAHHQSFCNFSAVQIARIVLASARINCRMAGRFYFVGRDLSTSQIIEFLEEFSCGIESVEKHDGYHSSFDLGELAYTLIARGINVNAVDAPQLLRWLQSVCGHNTGPENSTPLNTALYNANQLRRSVQQIYLLDHNSPEKIRYNVYQLGRFASALHLTDTDIEHLLHALPTEDERWKEIVLLTRHSEKDGCSVRQAAQRFALNKPADQEWLQNLTLPRTPAEWEIDEERRSLEQKKEKSLEKANAISWYSQNLNALRAGGMRFIRPTATMYLGLRQSTEFCQNTHAEDRISLTLSSEIAQAAHEGFEAYLVQSDMPPSAEEITQECSTNGITDASFPLIAAMLERLRKGLALEDLSEDRIMAGFFLLHFCSLHNLFKVDVTALSNCLIKEVKKRELLEKASRLFYEPQLQADVKSISGLTHFMHEACFSDISLQLAQQWLVQFPSLCADSENQLIDRLIRAEQFDVLKALVRQRMRQKFCNGQHLAWQAVRLLADFENTTFDLDAVNLEPALLWQLQTRSQGNRYQDDHSKFAWSSAQLAWIFQKFRHLWPLTSMSDSFGDEDQHSWAASEFLLSLAKQLANTITHDSIAALRSLRDAPADGYTEQLQALYAEQLRKRCEHNYLPLSVAQLASLCNDQAPQSIQQLKNWVLEELSVVQDKVRANDVDSWQSFYASDLTTPMGEEYCRNRLLELLRQGLPVVSYEPETHVADDKEVDITCSSDTYRLPVEIKGQWHRDVWTAADTQLDHQYTPDWRAHGMGIYLVLWFGEQEAQHKALQSPGKSIARPLTATEMQQMLIERSQAAQSGRVAVVVLDLSIPNTESRP